MKTLLRGGYVVSGRGCRRADVLIEDWLAKQDEKIEKEVEKATSRPSSPRRARSST